MRRLKVLLLPQKKLFHPWCDDVIQTIGHRHDLFVFDETQPLAPQFDEVELEGGLDVFSQEPPNPTAPLFQLPNVVVTPHIAGATYETSRRRAWCAAQNVDRLAQGLQPLYRIDMN